MKTFIMVAAVGLLSAVKTVVAAEEIIPSEVQSVSQGESTAFSSAHDLPLNSQLIRPDFHLDTPRVHYGEKLVLNYSTTYPIERATLVRVGAVPDDKQFTPRLSELDFNNHGRSLEVYLPQSPDTATPGRYFLFIIDSQGTPSRASKVEIADLDVASENLVKNGAFDTVHTGVTDENTMTLNRGDVFEGWQVTRGKVAIQSTGNSALIREEKTHLRLSTQETGEISQTIRDLKPGEIYYLSFQYALDDTGNEQHLAKFEIDGEVNQWVAHRQTDGVWQRVTYAFTASSPETSLVFEGTQSRACCGSVYIDDVTLTHMSQPVVAADDVSSPSSVEVKNLVVVR